jgi:thiaminase (transcriptional activator TenA)
MLHEMLWNSNLDLVQSCLAHPFVQALGDGSLSANLFRGFVAQDTFFLRAFQKAYALALARSESAEMIVVFCDLIAGVTEELKVHHAYATELGIDLQSVVPNPVCGAYTDFLLRTAWHASLAEIVAAMTPCMRLYAYLGGELVRTCGPQHPYRRWIEAYSGEEFQGLADRLEVLLDRVGVDRAAVRDGYRYALECELDFFTAALAS